MAVSVGRVFHGVVIRARRERALLSQEELAERSGLAVRTIRNIEAERVTRPHPKTMLRICAALAEAGAPYAEADEQTRSPNGILPVPHQLPADIADFSGRHSEIEQVCELLSTGPAPRIVAVNGLAGVGKTTLAVHAAHLLWERFPHGQLYVDLRGVQPKPRQQGEVLAQFLLSLGVDSAAIPAGLDERAALYRSLLDGRQILVLLDNAAEEAQVRPLLAGGTGCAHLITSRRRLVGLAGARTVALDVLARDEALTLLGHIVGTERIAGHADAEWIGTACGGLPLAIRIVGTRFASRPHWTPTMLAQLLDDERERLDELSAGDLDVRASFELSYQLLDDDHRRAFRLLGLLNTPDFPAWVLAVLLSIGTSGDGAAAESAVRRAGRVLEQLVDAQLLQVARVDRAGQTRYRFHDLLRLYAQERVAADEPADDRRVEVLRALSGRLALLDRADEVHQL